MPTAFFTDHLRVLPTDQEHKFKRNNTKITIAYKNHTEGLRILLRKHYEGNGYEARGQKTCTYLHTSLTIFKLRFRFNIANNKFLRVKLARHMFLFKKIICLVALYITHELLH